MLYLFSSCINTTLQKSPVDCYGICWCTIWGYHRYPIADGGAQLLIYNRWMISYPCLTRRTGNLALCYRVVVTFTTIAIIIVVVTLLVRGRCWPLCANGTKKERYALNTCRKKGKNSVSYYRHIQEL